MAVTKEITLDMALDEMIRIRNVMVKHYPAMVRDQKISPYTRDHRLAVTQKIIDLLKKAKTEKSSTFVSLLNQLR